MTLSWGTALFYPVRDTERVDILLVQKPDSLVPLLLSFHFFFSFINCPFPSFIMFLNRLSADFSLYRCLFFLLSHFSEADHTKQTHLQYIESQNVFSDKSLK